jgi:hypothetical protein
MAALFARRNDSGDCVVLVEEGGRAERVHMCVHDTTLRPSGKVLLAAFNAQTQPAWRTAFGLQP